MRDLTVAGRRAALAVVERVEALRRGRDADRRRAVGEDRIALAVEQRHVVGDRAERLLDARHRLHAWRACPWASSAAARSPPRRRARACTETSVPFCVRSNRSLNEASIVSVKTNVPATKATPMHDGEAGECGAQLAGPEALQRDLAATTPPPSSGRARPPWSRRRRRARPRPSLQHDDAVGDRGRVRVVRDHHHGLAEVVDRVAQQARAPRRRTSSPGCRSARRRTPPPGGGSARAPPRRAAAGRRTARTGGA